MSELLERRCPHVRGGDKLDARAGGQRGQQLASPNPDPDQADPQWFCRLHSVGYFGLPTSVRNAAQAEWGLMLSDSRKYLRIAWWLAVFPGASIMLTVLAINVLGDGVRDALDPRLSIGVD